MKKILALLLAVVMVAAMLASCGMNKSDLNRVNDAEKLVVGVTVYPPMDYLDENGEWTGFDAELAQQFADYLGVNCQIVIITWSQKVAVVKKGSTLTSDKVASATLSVENGSAGASVAIDDLKATKVNKVTAQVDALNEVLAGTSEAAIIDITMAQSVVGKGQYANLEILDGASYGEEIFAVGLRKGSDLKVELDKFLKEKYADGTLTELAEKYSVGLNTEALSK